MLEYKAYIGHVEFDSDADIFHGEVINTKDVITFQGSSVKEIHQAFQDSIDDYLAFCAERGEEAERPFSGKLNLRLKPELHRIAYITAKQHDLSLNSWLNKAIEAAIENDSHLQN